MGYSPLADQIIPTSKHSPRPGPVTRMIPHHWAGNGAIDWVLNKFVYSNQQSSVSYILRDSGWLIGSVDERYRPWTSNGAIADNPAITVEIENAPGPGYKISDKAIEKLTNLMVDVAIRHNWKQIRFGHEIRGHREFYPTNCPGDWFWARLPAIAREADRRLQARRSKKDWFAMATKKDLEDAVRSVLNTHNISVSGATKRALGVDQRSAFSLMRYGAAALFEGREWHADLVAQNKALTAAVETLAESKGADPVDIKTMIQTAVDRALKDLSVTLTVEGDLDD